MKHTIGAAATGLLALFIVESAHGFGASVFEPFNTSTGDVPAAVNAAYPGYLTRAVLSGGSPDLSSRTLVTGGELIFTNDNTGTISFITQGLGLANERFTVSVDLRATDVGTPGNYSLGLIIGNRAFGYFPGQGSAAFDHLARSYDASTGLTTSGYLDFLGPSAGIPITGGPNHLTVSWDGVNTWTYTFQKAGTGTGSSYTESFVDVGFVPGEVGVFSRRDTGTGNAIFDNLLIVPEPTSMALLVAGGLLLWRRR